MPFVSEQQHLGQSSMRRGIDSHAIPRVQTVGPLAQCALAHSSGFHDNAQLTYPIYPKTQLRVGPEINLFA